LHTAKPSASKRTHVARRSVPHTRAVRPQASLQASVHAGLALGTGADPAASGAETWRSRDQTFNIDG
jgi:hypothetical protein